MKDKNFRVLVDTDPGLGTRTADVDDGLALFLMFNNPEFFKIEGITTIFGNTPVNKGFKLLKKYLNIVNRINIPHKLGASSKDDFGRLNNASRFLIEMVKENPDELTLLPLGPLTNIATALKHYPEFFDNLKKIVIMGGTLKSTKAFSPRFRLIDDERFNQTEFNFYSDPISTKLVIETETLTPRIGMGLDICCQAVFKDEHLKKIESVNTQISQFIAKNIQNWLKLWKFNHSGGFYPFDTFVPIYLLNPELFKSTEVFLNVETINIPGKISITKKKRINSAPITYCTNFADKNGGEKFMGILLSNLIK